MQDFGRRALRTVGIVLIAGGLGLGLVQFLGPAAPPAPAALPNADLLTETFVRVAVGAEPTPLRIWQNDVRILINGENGEVLRPVLERAAESFAHWTGVPSVVVGAPEQGFNVLVQSMPRADYTRLVGNLGGGGEAGRFLEERLVCYSTALSRADAPALLRATVAIPDDLDATLREQCVWHELMHVYGIFGHPDERVASVLRDAITPTLADIVLLRALYDPRLAEVRAAQAPEQVRPVIEAILDQPEAAATQAPPRPARTN